jgi:Family 4 glycosyl hydrolase
MPKITFIGAGSTVFAKNLLGDILGLPELAGSTISLFDVDAGRLSTSEIVAHRTAEALGAPPARRGRLAAAPAGGADADQHRRACADGGGCADRAP